MSDSTTAHVDAAVEQLKAYVSPTTGETMARLVVGRVYAKQAPAGVQFPYVVVRKVNQSGDPEFSNLREAFDIEATCVHQSRDKLDDCEAIADLAEQALLTWRESSPALGLTYGQTADRDADDVGDIDDEPLLQGRDLVQIRVLVRCVSWPIRLTAAVA